MRALAILAMCAATTSAAAEPKPIALLTSVGSAKESAGREVDRALRQALLDEESVDLLAPVETREHVNSLAEMGLICLPEDEDCLTKLGTTALVELVLVPVIEKRGNGRVQVEIGVIDVGKMKRTRTVKAVLSPSDEAGLAALAREAIGLAGSGRPKPRDDRPPDDKPPDDKPPDDKPPDEPPDPAAAPPVGLIMAGIGGAVAGVAIAGAVVCDLIYADILDVADAKTRQDVIQPAGAALWIAGGVGLVVLGSGIALSLTESQPE